MTGRLIAFCGLDWPVPTARTLTVDTTGSYPSSNSSVISLNTLMITQHLPSKTSTTHSCYLLKPCSQKISVVEYVSFSDAGHFEKDSVEVGQFPLRPAYDTTFNGSQGLTPRRAVLDLRTDIFAHVQTHAIESVK
ncbi:hypothetical protein BDR07DRAFT_1478419 [Suillus spraguei]|nr:hypothetical protein BDR07DRAFT_1478419 [Suillus spraguei]